MGDSFFSVFLGRLLYLGITKVFLIFVFFMYGHEMKKHVCVCVCGFCIVIQWFTFFTFLL